MNPGNMILEYACIIREEILHSLNNPVIQYVHVDFICCSNNIAETGPEDLLQPQSSFSISLFNCLLLLNGVLLVFLYQLIPPKIKGSQIIIQDHSSSSKMSSQLSTVLPVSILVGQFVT